MPIKPVFPCAALLTEQFKDLSMILETLTSVLGSPEHHA